MLSKAVLLALLGSLVQYAQATDVMDRPAAFSSNTTSFPIAPRFNYTTNAGFQSQSVSALANGKVNMAYFTNWGIYSTGRNFPPQNIPASQVTHILYSFFDCDASSGAIKSVDSEADFVKHYPGDSWSETGNNVYGNIKQLYILKKANRHMKTLLSIGGWTYGQAGHFNFVTNPSARATFVSTAITALEDYGFDGIDIDYEYPTTTAQGQGFAALLNELKSALAAHQSRKGESVPYLVTAAVGAGPSGYNFLDIANMDRALDFWNLMAYDYSGSWSTVSDHQANWYGGTPSGFSTEAALSYYTSHGATKSKFVLGLPLYGRAFDNTNGIYQPYSGIGGGSWENGIWDYKALPRPGASVTEDTSKLGAYSYGNRLLVSYDTPNIAVQKTSLIKSQGLAGAMYWELSGDKSGSDSLVTTVKNNLGSFDTTQNHLNYPGSQYVNIRNQMGSGGGNTTDPPPQGNCGSVLAWSATTVYVAGDRAGYGGYLWQAKWWTQGDTPKVADGAPWSQVQKC